MQITRRSWKAKDRRMDTVNELLQNIRFLKYYGWGQYIRSDRARNLHTYSRAENHWADKTRRSREDELKWRVKENTVDTLISFIWSAELGNIVRTQHLAVHFRTWIPSATALTSFLCFTLIAGQRLTVAKAFTAIALFSRLQEPMTALPGQVFAMLHGTISLCCQLALVR